MYSNLQPYRPDRKPPMGAVRNPHLSINRGIVGDWVMWAGAGDTVEDLSGNGNTGTIANGAWQGGKFGSTIFFNDASTVIDYGDVLDIGTSDWSFGIWFKANWSAANEFHSLICKSRAQTNVGRYALWFESGVLQCNLQTGGGNKTVSTSETPYLDGNWHQAFVTIKRSGNITLYINGVSVGTPVDVSDGAAENYNIIELFGVGAYLNAAGTAFDRGWFDGWLDVPMIYNRDLSASEIALLCQEPFCGFRWTSIIELAAYVAAGAGTPLLQMNHFNGGMAA